MGNLHQEEQKTFLELCSMLVAAGNKNQTEILVCWFDISHHGAFLEMRDDLGLRARQTLRVFWGICDEVCWVTENSCCFPTFIVSLLQLSVSLSWFCLARFVCFGALFIIWWLSETEGSEIRHKHAHCLFFLSPSFVPFFSLISWKLAVIEYIPFLPDFLAASLGPILGIPHTCYLLKFHWPL